MTFTKKECVCCTRGLTVVETYQFRKRYNQLTWRDVARMLNSEEFRASDARLQGLRAADREVAEEQMRVMNVMISEHLAGKHV